MFLEDISKEPKCLWELLCCYNLVIFAKADPTEGARKRERERLRPLRDVRHGGDKARWNRDDRKGNGRDEGTRESGGLKWIQRPSRPRLARFARMVELEDRP